MNTNYTLTRSNSSNNNLDITSVSLDPDILRLAQRLRILKNKTITLQPPVFHPECPSSDLK